MAGPRVLPSMSIAQWRKEEKAAKRLELEDTLAAQIRQVGLPEPVREHSFMAPARRFRFDFAWPGEMVAAEVEGGSWSNGAHTRGRHFESDCVKYSEAAIRGWQVLRFTGDMVKDGRAVQYLSTLLVGPEENP
jgi:hypothetical protein